MNSLHAMPARRLAFGVSRLSIRHAQIYHSQTRLATTAASPATAVKAKTEEVAVKPEEKEKTRAERWAEEGRVHFHTPYHGEKIWIHNHTYDGHILYSFTRTIDVNKAYRQMPYTGKKNVPAKLRKDYWQPMAVIDFGPGLGEVGRSVYQKLREFKKRHELEWGRDDPEEEYRLLHMSKHERGKALNDQRPNAVADVAAVLSGVGKGSKMWKADWEDLMDKKVRLEDRRKLKVPIGIAELAEADKTTSKNRKRMERLGVAVQGGAGKKFVDWQTLTGLDVRVNGSKQVPHQPNSWERYKHEKMLKKIANAKAKGSEVDVEVVEIKEEPKTLFDTVADETTTYDLEEFKKLHGATIYWAKPEDIRYAANWTDNVEHVIGLPHMTKADSARYWKGRQEPRPELPASPVAA
ncbi:transcriptional regulation of mitochondrial recombination-domain-containing protein [Immersiella caudata]|uniref:Large ribosomal subunit protein mL67 n=1 Tax=Immersiella caudata TaxID=314043 RepID=A0AA39WWI3_9PEZI|nr:transcriptional regulation of mitochondrial recombination-domain-containing protein [Immersiella caudata]